MYGLDLIKNKLTGTIIGNIYNKKILSLSLSALILQLTAYTHEFASKQNRLVIKIC